MLYLYGPLIRAGSGFLRITLTPYKTCDFDCIYCQLGKTKDLTAARKEYIPIAEIIGEFRAWLENYAQSIGQLNYITLSGSGEPILNEKISQLIAQIKSLTDIPVRY